MSYWLGLCVLRRTCRQNRLYETLFHTVIILSKHHHHHHQQIQGILMGSSKRISTKEQLARLWTHECERVFGDRYVDIYICIYI
jgi:hypothetical protein